MMNTIPQGGYIIASLVICIGIGVLGCEVFDRDETSNMTAPAEVTELSNFIVGDPEIINWGAQYTLGNTYIMVNIPVAGALKVEYRMKDGGAFALFLATTASVKLEIGLETRDVTATAKSVVDVLDRVCVTYQEGGTFASTPANIAANVQNTWTHYQRKETDPATNKEQILPWWLPDAQFTFSGVTQTVCVIDNSTVQVTGISGPFPRPESTTTTTTTTTVTTTTTTTTTTLPAVTAVVMYSAGQHDGNLGGRAGADALCASAKPSGLHAGYTQFKAFISINTGDAIADLPFPAGLPIQGPTGTLIDNNRAGLLDGDILTPLDTAGVLPAPDGTFWSGSDDNGNYDAGTTNNCQNFTSAAASDSGVFGDSLSGPPPPPPNWDLGGGSYLCDQTALNLLCIAY